MPASREGSGPPVWFDDVAFNEDLSHATAAGRKVALEARRQIEERGIAVGDLRRCQEEGPDGTELRRCVKLYLPPPEGPWRMVFEFIRRRSDGRLSLGYLSFGLGHPSKAWSPSAYRVAHERLQRNR